MTLSLVSEHGEVAVGYDRSLRERNRLIRDGVRDPGWFDALEGADGGARGAAVGEPGGGAGAARGGAGGGGLPAGRAGARGRGAARRGGAVAALREGRGRDLAAGRSLVGPHRDDLGAVYAAKGMPARLASTGEQKALLVSLVLANARAVAQGFGAPPLLLLDEVAAHLDDGRRAALFDAVLGLGAQAWMTGTEPGLFDGLGDRVQRLRVAEAGENRGWSGCDALSGGGGEFHSR